VGGAALSSALLGVDRIAVVPSPSAVSLTTSDGVRLAAQHWDTGLRDLGCVVAHGFTGSSQTLRVVAICRELASRGIGVLAVDLRGHGGSGGYSTVGADETHDIAASVDWLRGHGYRRVAALGWSMGGSAVLRYAGLGGPVDAVVSVSSPGRWFERGTRPMRVLEWMVSHRSGRVLLRLTRHTRVSPVAWAVTPEAPHEVVGAIAPTPLLVVHGDADHYFPMEHPELLRAAAPDAHVWIEPGMAHAETATEPELVQRIADWLTAADGANLGTGGTRVPRTAVDAQVCDDGARD